MKIEDLQEPDRTLVVVALQSLHRERVNSANAVRTACELAGKPMPHDDVFGIDEATHALRRIRASPLR